MSIRLFDTSRPRRILAQSQESKITLPVPRMVILSPIKSIYLAHSVYYKKGTTWLNPDKTLREQLILETDTVLLKKKFFFSDQTIDQNDPIQLGLLYNQAVEMILTGKHPCHLDEAIQFAALQLQVLYGNHEPDKHKKQTIK